MSKLLLCLIVLISVGCGIKGKPLPPLTVQPQEPETAEKTEIKDKKTK